VSHILGEMLSGYIGGRGFILGFKEKINLSPIKASIVEECHAIYSSRLSILTVWDV